MLAIKTNKLIILIIIGIMVISINTISNAKYVLEYVTKVADVKIDRTAPILNIEYSTKEYTNGNVEVKVISNEIIQEVDGWQLLEDKKTLVKNYEANVQEEIKVMDLSGNKSNTTISIENIDKIAPKAEIIKISNSNVGYEKYANKQHEIITQIKIYDEKKLKNNFNDFIILVGTKENGYKKEFKIIEERENYIIYEIKLTNIIDEGKIVFKIPENSFEDYAGNKLIEISIESEVLIDNTVPQVKYNQEVLNDGKVFATINSNETLRALEGWSYNEKINSKVFISDVKYQRTVKDLAGNETIVDINVQGSTFLGLECAAIISEVGFSDIENYLIGNMYKGNVRKKLECIIFRTSNNVSDDFLKIEAFTNTYWGTEVYSISKEFNMKCITGYSGYKTMANSKLVTYLGKKYMHFGGEGANLTGNTDINGNNPLPLEIATQYLYGVSGIKMDLSEHSEYSIIYQIFFDDTGWLKPCTDGEETMRAKNQPIEALRFVVVPISEKTFVLDKWNSDIGTYNVD